MRNPEVYHQAVEICKKVAVNEEYDPYQKSLMWRKIRHGAIEAELLNLFFKFYPQDKPDYATYDDIYLGALLHDIGTSFYGEDWWRRTGEGNHVKLGMKYLKDFNLSPATMQIISQHHEKPNGKGHPEELPKTEISYLGLLIGYIDKVVSACEGRPPYEIGKSEPGKSADRDLPKSLKRAIESVDESSGVVDASIHKRFSEVLEYVFLSSDADRIMQNYGVESLRFLVSPKLKRGIDQSLNEDKSK
jgi:putative nucleotidyltransferase with HDIG domain